ncbi:amidase [Phaeovulum sp. W22_SRMD_FR3]|uniref:amidase n=1 Tax=Phaeovulum sp. W22_SRMD_FR3 TaxID=3240274 RepID=UPI003F96782F
MLLKNDPYHAFMPYEAIPVASASEGPLAGLTVAVKDLFDVAGYRTGSGCPLKLAASPVMAETAPAVQRLFDAGARFVGKTHTDELAWSLYGLNAHFGTPINPAAPDRIPGGSSSGSAVAVAGGLADIAVGSDTGGSIRAPASFCGIWGLRPSHGRISLEGAQALAPSFDTAGLFARDGATLHRAAEVMIGPDTAALPDSPDLLWPEDMHARLNPEARSRVDRVFGGLHARPVTIYPDSAATAYACYLGANGADCAETILPYIRRSRMPLVRGIDSRADSAEALTEAQKQDFRAARAAFRSHLRALLGAKGVLLAPAVHDAPFRLDAPVEIFDGFRHEAMHLLCVAGMAGLPQVVFPAGQIGGAPYGASLIGPYGSDLSLIALACKLAPKGAA